jgi:hypothetical protein
MGEVCGYLDGYVQLGLVEATYENTRFALRELACMELGLDDMNNTFLQKGYGCDGIDNTCDEFKEIDECAEDIFPPDIDATLAFLECGNKTFTDATEAMECVAAHTSAVDDCKAVATDTTTATIDECTATVTFTAIAQGCNGRIPEDTSTVAIPVKLDKQAPIVKCSFASGTSLPEERFVDETGTLMILSSSDDELADGVFSMDVEVCFVPSMLATLRSEWLTSLFLLCGIRKTAMASFLWMYR